MGPGGVTRKLVFVLCCVQLPRIYGGLGAGSCIYLLYLNVKLLSINDNNNNNKFRWYVAMAPDGPEQALRLGGHRALQCYVSTPSSLFRPQTGSLGRRAKRRGWRGPKLLRPDRGHGFRRAVEGLMKRWIK